MAARQRACGRRGCSKGDRVAALLANSPPMLEAHFGVPAAGGILVTINTRLAAGRDRVHPRPQRRALPARRRGVRPSPRFARSVGLACRALRGHRHDRGPVRGVPRRRVRGRAGQPARARRGDDLDQLHVRDHRSAEGRAVHIPRRVSQRAQRGHRGRPVGGVRLPVDAADVPLQRMVLSLGRDRGRGAPRAHADRRPRARVGAHRQRGRDELQRRAHRAPHAHEPPQGTPRGATGDGLCGGRPAVTDAVRADDRAELPCRARLRPDRDLRADHGLPRAGDLGRATRSSSEHVCSRAKARHTSPPTSSASSTKT